MRPSVTVITFFLLGCAAAPPPPARGSITPAIADWDRRGRSEATSVELAREPVVDRFATRRIVEDDGPRFPQALTGAGPRVDVSLQRAPLSSALRLLADAADLGLVVGEGVETPVSLDLRRVGAIEAMRALAQAHDIELDMVGRTVIARRR